MTHYQDELEQLRFSSEEKQVLTRRLLEAGRKAPVRPHLPYRRLVAAVAAVSLLVGAAGAVSLAGLSPAFRDLFGISSQEQAQQLGAVATELVFADQNGSGAFITVQEIVADQEQLYLHMEFTAPEGVVLPQPDEHAEGKRCWLDGSSREINSHIDCAFYADQGCTQPVSAHSYTFGADYLWDDDPTDNRVDLLFTVSLYGSFPAGANYCAIENIGSLNMWKDGASVTLADGMDIDVVVPVQSDTPVYAFEGRCPVKLGGTTLAVVENLVISPITITFDLLVSGQTAYSGTPDSGSWDAYVLLEDGTQVAAEPAPVSRDIFHEDTPAQTPFFQAYHMRLTLAHPIDLSQIADIVFEGDNSRVYDGQDHTGEVVYFHFWPSYFRNNTYWDTVSQAWRRDS